MEDVLKPEPQTGCVDQAVCVRGESESGSRSRIRIVALENVGIVEQRQTPAKGGKIKESSTAGKKYDQTAPSSRKNASLECTYGSEGRHHMNHSSANTNTTIKHFIQQLSSRVCFGSVCLRELASWFNRIRRALQRLSPRTPPILASFRTSVPGRSGTNRTFTVDFSSFRLLSRYS